MAKSRKVFIDVVVDDKGTTKRVAVNAKKLGIELEGTGKSAQTADRNLKGAARTSSNATKNFSKMAQGISGGLVPAYATLAAQVFAITAAFNFLKSAADFQVLATGQEAYARSTGIAIKTLSTDIVAATNAQIGFKDASQAAAIGLASGLSPDQLTKLGTAARDASAVLGRDVTDSFNRLVRGVTKAEPELLDELGIILRLETASKAYAEAIGKDVKELTQFEKSQAVANDVLTQAEEKYSAVLTEQQKLGNAVTKLGKAFENQLLKPFQEALTKGITPIITFLSDNIPALAGALALLAIPIMKSIIPGLKDMGEAAENAANESAAALEKEIDLLDKKEKAFKELQKTEDISRKKAAAAVKDDVKALKAKPGSGLAKVQGGGIPTDRQLAGMIRAAEKSTGEYKKLSDKQRAHVVRNFKLMKASSSETSRSMVGHMKVFGSKSMLIIKRLEVGYQRAMTKMKRATIGFANAADKAMKGLGIVGMVLLAVEAVQGGITALSKLFESAEEGAARVKKELADAQFDALKSRLRSVNEELTLMEDKAVKAGSAGAKFVGNMLANINVLDLEKALKSTDKDARALAVATVKSYSEVLGKAGNVFGAEANFAAMYGEAIVKNGKYAEASIPLFLQYISKLQELGQAGGNFEVALKGMKEQQQGFIQGLKQTSKYDSMIDSINLVETSAGKTHESTLSTEERAALNDAINLRKALVKLRDQEFHVIVAKLEHETKYNQLLHGATPLEKARLTNLKQQDTLQLQIKDKLTQIEAQKRLMAEDDTIDTVEAQKQLTTLEGQIGALLIQNDLLKEQRDLMFQIGTASKAAFETSLTTNLKDLITGQESSFKDAIVNIARSTLDAVAETLAKRMSENFTEGLFGESKQASQIRTAHKEGGDYVAQKIKEALGTPASGAEKSAVAGVKTTSNGSSNVVKTTEVAGGGGIRQPSGKIASENMIETPVTGKLPQAGGLSGLFGNFVERLTGLFDGDAPFLNKLGGLFGGLLNDFGGIFKNLFSGLSGMFGAGGTGAGGFFSSIAGIFGFANGGVVKGGFRKYANGGIAKSPHIGVIGEGRYNEAVVPLPDGRSIPVTPGAGMGTNNVTVNVSIDNEGKAESNTQSDSSMGADLGKLVARAVQEELQYQKRSGGILNPYGAA